MVVGLLHTQLDFEKESYGQGDVLFWVVAWRGLLSSGEIAVLNWFAQGYTLVN